MIAVTDQGCGIAEHHLKRIFEHDISYRAPHVTLKSGGSVLLYIAQMPLIKLMVILRWIASSMKVQP